MSSLSSTSFHVSASPYVRFLPDSVKNLVFQSSSIQSPLDESRLFLFPGFCDVHVHFREPGFSYKETIRTGSLSAARGGYTAVCPMPNLNPVPDTLPHLSEELALIRDTACIHVYPYGAISMEEKGETLADLESMAEHVIAFSDDGHGVQQNEIMREAMLRAKALGKIIAAHCEDNSLLRGGCIHDGSWAREHGFPGICSESEWGQIARDLELCAQTGCSYHVCHISTKESVHIIREAKKSGIDVTCETGPHYLVLDDHDLIDEGRFKMNPPLRGREDREALIEGLQDGTIDMIATDHAPHAPEEKAKGLRGSAFGIVGLECAFPVLYTRLVRKGLITLQQLIDRMAYAPRKRFRIPLEEDSFTLWDLGAEETIDPDAFLSMGRSTPFAGDTVSGRCLLTVSSGKTVYRHPSIA
ncbi:MAG: dihydroorotase [Clostridia bacterium]|nr:dihydroorotase [Clostridia bacterium]